MGIKMLGISGQSIVKQDAIAWRCGKQQIASFHN
jgi:hypothetical protein